ncbi:nicotinate (nicotinamide) nucleotide adenylyltransferase [Rubrivirga sp. S365]|uniref:Probable nicotinate-nucleotide adenylyltransferase n=1 Tax=Rubrivirga litoralis TaxID=3075598 RepID=A0ABU3BU51_9BACT|nr:MULTISPECIES: nicotinate (nicotinamide) nucleotide adenylyltransferase [unclassified Rubrivirga]MDT0632822.1 nicotinate (nicotinamide) nucleotide adenylyltransferase [Rubrivirga sp. F394]MDT7855100.1 nicotinate (nicotinamide) nucleotide adenylyltransferase [Rubrivirga sp. S365]
MPSLALFGGSFNPPHVGHLAVAEACAEAVGLERVLWAPAATPPHKRGHADMAPAADRLALVRAAVAGNERFEAWGGEVERGGTSYTVDTLRALAEQHPGAEIALVLGGDSLAGFASWREPRAILDLARLVVYDRPGADLADVPAWVTDHATRVAGPLVDLSSTELRARIRAGRTVRYLVPDAVRAEIAARGLYAAPRDRPAPDAGENTARRVRAG